MLILHYTYANTCMLCVNDHIRCIKKRVSEYNRVPDQHIIGEEMLCRGVGLMDEERTDMAFRASLCVPQ